MSKIILLSSYLPKEIYDFHFHNSDFKPGMQIQNFLSLLEKGFKENSIELFNISVPPINRALSKKIFFNKKNIHNFYIVGFINIPLIRQISIIINIIKHIILNQKKYKKSIFISDGLNISVLISLFFYKLFKRNADIVILITDLPNFLYRKNSIFIFLISKLNNLLLKSFSKFIIITDSIRNQFVSKNNLFFVLDGFVDYSDRNIANNSFREKAFLYSGALNNTNNLDTMLKAFLKLDSEEFKLYFIGEGKEKANLIKISGTSLNKKVFFLGQMNHEIVLEWQKKVSFLVNPRFSNNEFTKYSFPSKFYEYLNSGTPVISTKLPNIPHEIIENISLFQDESEEGFYRTFQQILTLNYEKLIRKSLMAQNYVQKNKSPKVQIKKLLRFLMK